MNLAYFSPQPPLPSGVADYSAVLLPYLRPHFTRVAVLVDGYSPQLPAGLVDDTYDISEDADWWDVGKTVPLYHMGNHIRYHRYVYETLQRFPGVTVLHDGNLLPFIHELTLAEGKRGKFIREAGFERGSEGITAAWTSLRRGEPLDLESYPMLARVARTSLGVIVHNQYLCNRVLDTYPQARVAVIPFPDLMPLEPDPVPRHEHKLSLGFNANDLMIGAFGFIAPSKGLERALRAFADLRHDFPEARFVCVGEVVPSYDFGAVLSELALGNAVRVTGYVPMELFLHYLRAVDVGVNLRYPTWGESSATLTRLMGCGVPTLVTDAGAFSELPDEAVIKVPPGSDKDELATIEEPLRDLLKDENTRGVIGAAARAFVADQCNPHRVAEEYAAFVRLLVGGECRL